MSAKPKPTPAESSRRRGKAATKKRAPRPKKRSSLSRADRALIARLEKAGLLVSGPDAGTPLDDDDEILKPGPPCPGAVEALIESRSGP